jgi:hypothetical protein
MAHASEPRHTEPPNAPSRQRQILITALDENGIPVQSALVTISLQGRILRQLRTDYLGRCLFLSSLATPYQIQVEKAGFYVASSNATDPDARAVELILPHQQQVKQEVNVVDSIPAIDPQQITDARRMDTPEIVNIPYPTSRDIRNLIPFNPGVVQDATQQVHVAGSSTYETLDLLDGFNITSPLSGLLTMRFSPDAIRSLEIVKTRYPVEYGRATGGIIAFRTGMGDDRFRFNATNFIPSVQNKNGLKFDKFVPRLTFSGPIQRRKAWFYDGMEIEFDNTVITELPNGANTNPLWRGSNLAKVQVNLAPGNIMTAGFLINGYHSPYEGISPLVPRQSTVDRNNSAWIAYVRDQHTFDGGAVLDLGISASRFRDSFEPHGNTPFQITPELSTGSFFENLVSHSRRVAGEFDLYLPPQHLAGRHDLKMGVDVDQINYDQNFTLAPISYLREDGTLLRQSTFTPRPAFTEDNFETGGYAQDRWSPSDRLLVEAGVRFDWDRIIRDPLFSPRIAITYMLNKNAETKISAGIGIYHNQTQLEYLSRVAAGTRTDAYYALDGVTRLGPTLPTTFIVDRRILQAPKALNWSLGLEQKIPGAVYFGVSFMQKWTNHQFNYVLQNPGSTLFGTYLLENSRQDHYYAVDFSARHTFSKGYTLFGSYTRSSARTNAVLDYFPTLSILGPQGSGPLPWDTPNRVLSWGWLPIPKVKRLDFVYTFQWRTGFPFTSVDANRRIVGAPDSMRFPNYLSISPGIELRFHLHKYYLGLRGVLENATNHKNPLVVNNVVDSRQYLTFSELQGRALTARIRLIGSK